jgi:hypothetical protein
MAFPGRPQTFALENCRDLLNKLEREIVRFNAAGNDIEDRKDFAFNAAVTAWSLCDWVFEDMTQAHCDKFNIRSRKQMQDYARKHCRALHLCRQVATASKHCTVERFPDPKVATIVTTTPSPTESEPQAPSIPPLHVAAGCFVYFVDGDDKRDAGDVFGGAFEFWTQFIYHNGIAADETHADRQ